MLGFGRALGETMAVTMVIGNNPQVSASLFAPQYTMAAVLANEFTEAADELYLHALDRDRPGAVHHHADRQLAVAAADLEHGAQRDDARPAVAAPADGGGRMSRTVASQDRVVAVRRLLRGCRCCSRSCRWPSSCSSSSARASSRSTSTFFTHMPKPVGEPGGGMANAIVGTLILTGLGVAVRGSDRHRERRLHVGVRRHAGSRRVVRFAADTLNGVPSIVIGVFVYGIAVLPFKQFSALAGGLALGIMMIPIIARTTEELLLLVPGTMREGALALGATRARAVFTVVLPAALPGIITGVVLALARIAGETAPLLFTSFNNRFFTTSLTQPISSLTVQVYTYAISPYEDWHRQAWAGALVLVAIVLICSLLARFATRRLESLSSR